jgi:hypothetical protein
MSTRSRIGTRNTDGSITSIYCHSDGYASWMLPILTGHYREAEKIGDLMMLGDLSQLGPEIGERHDYNTHHDNGIPKGWCLSFSRDRSEFGCEAVTSATWEEFSALCEECGAEHVYLWTAAKGWEHWFYGGSGSPFQYPDQKKRDAEYYAAA